MLAQEEVREMRDENALETTARVYQDGLQVRLCLYTELSQSDQQSSDGTEDTTFCVRLVRGKQGWGGKRPYPWELENDLELDGDSEGETTRSSVKHKAKSSRYYVPPLTTHAPQLLIFRARSKVSPHMFRPKESAMLMVAGTRPVGVGDQC